MFNNFSDIADIDVLAFNTIYEALEAHALVSKKFDSQEFYSILDYVQSGIAVNIAGLVSSASLTALKSVGVISSEDNIHIAMTLAGLDFYQFLSVPRIRCIDARRLRLALFNLGLLGTVTGAIAALPQSAQIDWEYATTIREDYPLVVALATNLGLDTDAIFTLASSLA